RVAAEFFQGAALAQQIPVLIELDLDFPQPLLIGIGRRLMLIEALLFRHQFPNVVEHRPVGRLCLPGGMFVCHLQFLLAHAPSNERWRSRPQDSVERHSAAMVAAASSSWWMRSRI